MITIVVQRDDVAAGDSIDLSAIWEFDDGATIDDLIVRAIDEHFLASVAGDVAWTLQGGDIDLSPDEDGWYLAPNGRQIVYALIEIDNARGDEPSEVWVNVLARDGRIARLYGVERDGKFPFYFRYSSGGSRRPIDEMRTARA